MTARLPGLRPGEPGQVQRTSCDDMAASAIPWAKTGGARAIAEDGILLGGAIVNAFEVPVAVGAQPESSAP